MIEVKQCRCQGREKEEGCERKGIIYMVGGYSTLSSWKSDIRHFPAWSNYQTPVFAIQVLTHTTSTSQFQESQRPLHTQNSESRTQRAGTHQPLSQILHLRIHLSTLLYVCAKTFFLKPAEHEAQLPNPHEDNSSKEHVSHWHASTQ